MWPQIEDEDWLWGINDLPAIGSVSQNASEDPPRARMKIGFIPPGAKPIFIVPAIYRKITPSGD